MNSNIESANVDNVKLPKTCRWIKKSKLGVKEYEYVVYPTNDTSYNLGTSVQFNMQIDQGSTLKCVNSNASYMSFRLIVAGFSQTTDVATLDNSAHAVILRVQTSAQSLAIEDFNGVNRYIPVYYDLCVDTSNRLTYWTYFGTSGLSTNTSFLRKGYAFAADTNVAYKIGAYFATLLPSGLIGCYAQRMYPLSELPYQYIMYLDSSTNAFCVTGATNAGTAGPSSCSIDNIRVRLSVNEFSPEITAVIKSRLQTLVYPMVSIAQFQQSISCANGSTSWQLQLPYKNVKSLIFFIQLSTAQVFNQYSLSARSKLGISNYYLQIGSYRYPKNRDFTCDGYGTIDAGANNVKNVGSGGPDPVGFLSAVKALGNTPDNNSNSCVSYSSFNLDYCSVTANDGKTADATLFTNSAMGGSFVMGFNLEYMGQDDEFRSAMDCTNQTVTLNYTKAVTPTANASTDTGTIYCYAIYEQDLILQLQPGGYAIPMLDERI